MTERTIADPEVSLLAGMAGLLETEYISENDEWRGSPFGWIRQETSRRKGKIFEQIVSGWCAAKGLDVTASANSEADRLIGGLRVEIKGSTKWHNGALKFQQLRDQEYDIVVCLGILPFDARCWVIPKAILMARPPGVRSQHGGQGARETAWLSVGPLMPQGWLNEWGGSLVRAITVLRRLAAAP